MSTTTDQDLLQYVLDHAGAQVDKVFEGISETAWTQKSCEQAMTPAQTAEHLCEVYTAFKKMAAGEDHEWGNYSSGIATQDGILEHMKKLREEACAIAVSSDDKAKGAYDYIVMHDCYHVGQMALNRMAADPTWDPYSIYGG